MLLFNHCLLRLAVLAGISNSAMCSLTKTPIHDPSMPSYGSKSTPSSFLRNLAQIDNQTPTYLEEITCPDQSYTGFIDLTYTYSVETLFDTNPFDVISNIEGEILLKLSETVLSCEGGGTDADDSASLFSKDQLGIVGINSKPEDKKSQLCAYRCDFNADY